MLAGQAVRGLPATARPAGNNSVAFPKRSAIRSFKHLSRSHDASATHRASSQQRKAASAVSHDDLMASTTPVRKTRRSVQTRAAASVQASYAASDSPKSSLTPVLLAVAVASLGALLFGLHVAVVNGLQDAVSTELGFFTNTGLRGAVRCCLALHAKLVYLASSSIPIDSFGPCATDGVHSTCRSHNW